MRARAPVRCMQACRLKTWVIPPVAFPIGKSFLAFATRRGRDWGRAPAECGRIATGNWTWRPMLRNCWADVVPIAAQRYHCDMKVNGTHTRTIWLEADGWSVGIIDQTMLPHRYATLRLTTLEQAAHAIKSMQVRGAPLIGVAAAYGMSLALRADASDEHIERAYAVLHATRPTAINLKWALDEMVAAVRNQP